MTHLTPEQTPWQTIREQMRDEAIRPPAGKLVKKEREPTKIRYTRMQ